jgi:hypothetical protein
MKPKRLFLLGWILLAIVAVLALTHGPRDADTVLSFQGYSLKTNGTQVACFELRNKSRSDIWLRYGGTEFPLRAPFLERPTVIPEKTQNADTSCCVVSAGSYFMTGERLSPAQTLLLEFPMVSGKPALQVGVEYYVGNFKDGNDFLGNGFTYLLASDAHLGERIAYYWRTARQWFHTPKRCEVWCPQSVVAVGQEEKTKISAR